MVRRILPLAVAFYAALWAWQGQLGTPTQAEAAFPNENTPASFYNYYVHPMHPEGVGAELYLCPRPAPPLVGHTYITYEPLSPHEFLYRHSRTYWRYNSGAGWTRAKISWR